MLSDGTVRNGFVLGSDKSVDIALLVIDGYQLPALDLKISGRPNVGDEVLAMGYALDLPGTATLTKGMVSAFRSNVFGSLTVLQTDTAINPGNSGGPLFDLTGQVVGINTATVKSAQGINFAIVMDEAIDVINRLEDGELLSQGTFVDEQNTFSIKTLDGWKVYDLGHLLNSTTDIMSYIYMREDKFGAEMFIIVQAVGDNVSTDQFADTQTKFGSDQDEFIFYEKISKRRITLSELPAWEVIETWQKESNDFSHKGAEYFIVSRGLGYSIYTQSHKSDWVEAKSVVSKIIESFTINARLAKMLSTGMQTATFSLFFS